MPVEYATEVTRLHKMFIQGKFDPLTVDTDHKTIRAHQRRVGSTPVAGRVAGMISEVEMRELEMQETMQEMGAIPEDVAELDISQGPQPSDGGYSGPFTDKISGSGTADGNYGTVVRGGYVARIYVDRPRDPTRASRILAAALVSKATKNAD